MQVVSVPVTERASTGKRAAQDFRNQGLIPAVLYGGDSVEHFGVKLNDVKSLIYTPDFKIAEIQNGSEKVKCIIKDLQIHPVTDDLMHIDFLRLVDNHPVKVEVPVRFKGTSPGVKEGGKLVQMMRRVKIKTTPEHLVDELFVDISELKLGNSVRVRDIEANDNLEIMTGGATPVANVEVPRALKSQQAAEDKEGGVVVAEVAEGAPQE